MFSAPFDTGRYEAAADISEIIELEEVMEKLELGPNGGVHTSDSTVAFFNLFAFQEWCTAWNI